MLESLDFEVWTLELHCAACTCASGLTVCNFCLLLNMARLQVGTWSGVVFGWRHIVIANGQSLLRLEFNPPKECMKL